MEKLNFNCQLELSLATLVVAPPMQNNSRTTASSRLVIGRKKKNYREIVAYLVVARTSLRPKVFYATKLILHCTFSPQPSCKARGRGQGATILQGFSIRTPLKIGEVS